MPNQAQRNRVEHLNEFLSAVFNEPVLIGDLLLQAGLDEEQVELLRNQRLEIAVDSMGNLVTKYLYSVLPSKRALIIKRRYCLVGEPYPTLAELGADLGVTRERIRQLQKSGVRRLHQETRRDKIRIILRDAAFATVKYTKDDRSEYLDRIVLRHGLEDIDTSLKDGPAQRRDRVIQKRHPRKTRQSSLPRNHGAPWTEIEEQEVLSQFDDNNSIEQIAAVHGRTSEAIRLRLIGLGRLAE